jgi:hypothetical protein
MPSVLLAQSSPDSIAAHPLPTVASAPITTYEQFVISNFGKPIELHHQNLIEGSEMVSLGETGLRRGTDYTIDYGAGVIRVIAAVCMGQLLRVSYQPIPDAPTPINPGEHAIKVMAAMTDITLPAKPVTSVGRFLGLANDNPTLAFGSQVTGFALSSPQPGKPNLGMSAAPDARFVIEDLSANLSHGIVSVGYEDISSAGSLANSNGSHLDADTVSSLQRQSGIKKFGFAMQGVDFGSTKVDNSLRLVSDGHGTVAFGDLSLNNGPFSLRYSGQRVSEGFLMFGAIPESDRDSVTRSVGIDLESIAAQYKTKQGMVGLTSELTTDSNRQRVSKEDLSLNFAPLKMDMGTQEVGMLFTQFSALPADQQQTMASQAGTDKKWLSMETAPIGKTGQPLKLNAVSLTNSLGSYGAADLTASGKGWSLQAADRKNQNSFAFQPELDDKQVGEDVQTVSKMYAPTEAAASDIDKSMYMFGDLDRYGFRFTAQPWKASNFDVEDVTLKGATDRAYIESVSGNLKNVDFTLHHTHIGSNFFEDNELMDFEQQKLGMDLGVDRTEATGNLKLTSSAKLAFNMANTNTQQGAALRNSFDYSDKRIDVSYSNQKVAPGFGTVPVYQTLTGLTDPDQGTLAMLNGFRDQIIQGRWQPSSRLSIQGQWEDQHNDSTGQEGYDHVINASWAPNKSTQVTYNYLDSQASNPFDVLYDNRMSLLMLTKDFGKDGKLQYAHEQMGLTDPNQDGPPPVVGQQAPPPNNPNVPQGESSEDALTYTANIDKKTQIQTQNSMMRFGDGTREDMSANTISREITPHFGLSYTETNLSKTGGSLDESNKYGFWLDIFKGMRFSYGFARDLNELTTPNSDNTTIGVTPGDAGPIHVDTVNYGVNSWDNLHNQVSSNYAVHNTIPFKLGVLTDLKFNVNVATSSDYSVYSQKNDLFNFGGKIGPNTFLVQYKSQFDQNNVLATDRYASFQTDQNPKKWIEASLKVKERDSVETGKVLIRDYSVTLRPIRNLVISDHLLTNPEVIFRPDVVLGSITSPWRINQYKLDYQTSKSTTIGATYEDRINDSNQAYFRTAGFDVELFKNTGSPLTLWYGMERGGGAGIPNESAERFYLKYFQQPGPDQLFNIFVGNISYAYTTGTAFNRNNWGLRGEYEYSFW